MRLTTGKKPIVTECYVSHSLPFYELDIEQEVVDYFVRKYNIPLEAVLTRSTPDIWGVVELRWDWYEVTL